MKTNTVLFYMLLILFFGCLIILSYRNESAFVQIFCQVVTSLGFLAVASKAFYSATNESIIPVRFAYGIITISGLLVVYSQAIDIQSGAYLLNSPIWIIANAGLCVGFFMLVHYGKIKYQHQNREHDAK